LKNDVEARFKKINDEIQMKNLEQDERLKDHNEKISSIFDMLDNQN